jgi:uncharacterized protein (DUF608 family)
MKFIIKKVLTLFAIFLLVGTAVISILDNRSIIGVRAQTQENEQRQVFSEVFGERMTIPEHCFNLSKAPSEYINPQGQKIKEEFNFPIGTFGNNYISYGPHGIDRIALYNNFLDPFGGSYYKYGGEVIRCLNGTFFGVYVNDTENTVTRILQQYSPADRQAKDYGLQPVEKMECYSNIPIGYYKYQDAAFDIELGLKVYSPLIVYDLKNSSLPTSVWVLNAYNPTDHPIEVSFLFSLENDIGWRSVIKDDSTWQRTGDYNDIREEGNLIGVTFDYNRDIMSQSRPEYLGNMTLATLKQPDVTVSYVSEWDTLGNGEDLLSSFSNSGVLSNNTQSLTSVEGEHIYAGAIAVKVILEPNVGKNIPFVLSTCFPMFNLSEFEHKSYNFLGGMGPNQTYNWYWTKYFNDSWSIAKYSFENYETWWTEITDWHEKLYSSGLSDETITYMLGSLVNLVSCVFFSGDNHWFAVNVNLLSVSDTYSDNDWFLRMFYPEILKYGVLEYCDAMYPDGFSPSILWNYTLMCHQEVGFVIKAYTAWLWNQEDTAFLEYIYKYCKKAVNFTMNQSHFLFPNKKYYNDRDGLIHNFGNDDYDGWSTPTGSHLNSAWLLCLKCMVSMAEKLNLSEDVSFYNKIFVKAQNSFLRAFWCKVTNHSYFKLCGEKFGFFTFVYYPNIIQEYNGIPSLLPLIIFDNKVCAIRQIIFNSALINEEILPSEKMKLALKTIYDINYDYNHEKGWITAVYGNYRHSIDVNRNIIFKLVSFFSYDFSAWKGSNSIGPRYQWDFATSLLTNGFSDEALKVEEKTVDNYLYRSGGVYVSSNDSFVYLKGTDKKNVLNDGKDTVDWYPIDQWVDLPCWSFYQAAAGFTPCVGGLKIKPRIDGDDVFYMTQFAGCKVEMNVTGSGDVIDYVEINGEPYTTFVDGNVFIPLENFVNQDKMLIHITLT